MAGLARCVLLSQAFNTGAAVPWALPGVGVVATQSFTDRRYGFRGLELLAGGAAPQAALDELREPDELAGFRQVAFMDASGATAQWTGGDCIPHAGNAAGENWCAQGNMLAAPMRGSPWARRSRPLRVAGPTADGRARRRGDGRRRLARPRWPGIVVVPAEGEPWERVVDLRVEDGDDSLVQLRRLLGLAEGYRRANRARPAAPGAAKDGLPEGYVLFLAMLDAAAQGDVAEGRRLPRRSSPTSRCGSRGSGGWPATRRCRRSERSWIS